MNEEDYKIAYENVMIANKMLEQENERLNNIINEIEDFCYYNEYKNVSRYIKELKENK